MAGTSLGHGAKDVPTDQLQQTQSVQAKGPRESGRQGQAALLSVAGAHRSLDARQLAVLRIRGEAPRPGLGARGILGDVCARWSLRLHVPFS